MTRSWAFTACCALAIFLVLLPLPWHWKTRNTGTLLYIGWVVTGNLIFMVNSIIWAGNWEDSAPIWCDICTKIIIGMSAGMTAASLCINRRLYDIATIKSVHADRDSRRRRVFVDLGLGLGLPVLIMVLSVVVQSNRYMIFEDIGCWPTTYPTLLAIPLVLLWPMMISVASLIYATLSIRAFLRARRSFNQSLNGAHGGINMSQFFRLMGLSSGEILFSLPLSIYILYLNLQTTQLPWVSWEYTHWDFHVITLVPMMFLKFDNTGYQVFMINQWAFPAGAFLFFIWFGFAGEAVEGYKKVYYKLVSPLGIKPKPAQPQPVRSQSTWASRLTSGTSSRAREEYHYPSLPEIRESDTIEEKASTDVDESLYKNGSLSNV